VYRLVHRAGGTITVTHGPRARFEVRLPRATGAARDAARGAAHTPADAAASAVNR
jgi:hypothetical protein